MSRIILLAAFIGSAIALTCYNCDSFLTCNNPQIEYCPMGLCYTITKQNQVTYKGCAASCSALPAYTSDTKCDTCKKDKCNFGMSEKVNNGIPIVRSHARRSIGHGAGVQNSGIGHGVSSNNNGYSGSYNAYGNTGGRHDKHIGHGAHAAHGIGGGAAPNKHHHRQRRSGSGIGIGQGARPVNEAMSSLAFVPVTLLIARLFQ